MVHDDTTFSETQLADCAEALGLDGKFIRGRLSANQRRAAILRDILGARGLDPGAMAVLEIGSHLGFGLLTLRSAKRRVGLEYYGENVARAIELARRLGDGEVEFIQGTAAELPFESGSFDLVQSHHVIEHMPPETWNSYLGEMARVLKPGGVCFLSFPHRHYPIEGHYGLPFLHWIPPRLRPRYAKWSPRYRHVREAEKTYSQTAGGQHDVTFTEFPTTRQVRRLARLFFSSVEDVTREFTRNHRMTAVLGPWKQKAASGLANTWLCPERKLLLRR